MTSSTPSDADSGVRCSVRRERKRTIKEEEWYSKNNKSGCKVMCVELCLC